MKHFNVPIVGFAKYKLDLVTQQITNGKGKMMRIRPDKRGTLITNLVDDWDKQRTVVVDKIVHSTLTSLGKWEASDVILRDVLLTHYKLLKEGINEMKVMDAAVLIKSIVPHAELSQIGKILKDLRCDVPVS